MKGYDLVCISVLDTINSDSYQEREQTKRDFKLLGYYKTTVKTAKSTSTIWHSCNTHYGIPQTSGRNDRVTS